MSSEAKVDSNNFNENELRDIMTEIESLESDFNAEGLKEGLAPKEGDPTVEKKEAVPVEVENKDVTKNDEKTLAQEESLPEEVKTVGTDKGTGIEETTPLSIIDSSGGDKVLAKELGEAISTISSNESDDASMQELIDKEFGESTGKSMANSSEKKEHTPSPILSHAESSESSGTASNSTSSSALTPSSQMDLHLSGDLNFELSLKLGKQTIKLAMDSEESFVIEMESGARFVVPLK